MKMNRPVRLVLDLQSNMEVLGKRHPFLIKYKAAVDSNEGKLAFVSLNIYSDSGFSFYDDTSGLVAAWAKVDKKI